MRHTLAPGRLTQTALITPSTLRFLYVGFSPTFRLPHSSPLPLTKTHPPTTLIIHRNMRSSSPPALFSSLNSSSAPKSPQSSTQSPSPPSRSLNPPTVSLTIPLPNGTAKPITIRPTSKANLQKLTSALSELIARGWILDDYGDAIHRHISFADLFPADRFLHKINAVAEEMVHDPHVAIRNGTLDGKDNVMQFMTVTCTTHNPRGLSVRDTRLAARVEELIAEFGGKVVGDQQGNGDGDAEWEVWREQRRMMRREIDEAVQKQEGACFIYNDERSSGS